jgi:lipopolysaccharide transport system ATP-binding protein
LCQTAIRLQNGRIVAAGPARDVIDSYLSMPTSALRTTFPVRPGRPSITGLRLNDGALRRGDFSAAIDFISPFPLRPPIVGIVVSSSTGQPVWGTNGRFHPWERTDFAVAQGTVICEAKSLPLAPAVYRVSVWLSDWHDDYDAKQDALSFEFKMDTNVTQRPPASLMGHLDWVPTWRMANSGEDTITCSLQADPQREF